MRSTSNMSRVVAISLGWMNEINLEVIKHFACLSFMIAGHSSNGSRRSGARAYNVTIKVRQPRAKCRQQRVKRACQRMCHIDCTAYSHRSLPPSHIRLVGESIPSHSDGMLPNCDKNDTGSDSINNAGFVVGTRTFDVWFDLYRSYVLRR
jgi:hypothetical protein